MAPRSKILFLSVKGETHPVVRRLNRAGCPTSIYIHDPAYRNAYKNVHPRLTLSQLDDTLKGVETVVIDTIARNKKTPEDLALLDKFGLSRNARDLYGPLGDKLRKSGLQVIGGGEEMAEYELDRGKGVDLAKKAGMSIPPYKDFKSIKEGIRFLQSSAGKGKRWVFKPDGNLDLDLTYPETFEGELVDLMRHKIPARVGGDSCEYILQEFVLNDDGSKGVECSNETWLCRGDLMHPNRTLEDKKLYSRKAGPGVGSQVNLVWQCRDTQGPIFKGLHKVSHFFKDHLGPWDVNAIFTKDGKAWFLEWTLRFGYSALYLFLTFISPGSLPGFFLDPFHAVFEKKGFVASQVITLWPFPSKHECDLKQHMEGNLINHDIDMKDVWWLDVYQDVEGKIRCAGADGLLGVVACYDRDREGAIKKAFKKTDDLQISGNKQFWPVEEHLSSHTERLNKLRRWGVNVF